LEDFALSYDREFKALNQLQNYPGVVKIEDYYFLDQNDQKRFFMILQKADKNLDELL
jgi:hypothetical protein